MKQVLSVIKGAMDIKSERGYTLVLVMIIISVTMISGLAISAAALTTSKQVYKTENRNKATDLAEMGVTYYKNLSIKLIQPAIDSVAYKKSRNINTNFCTEFTDLLDDNDGTVVVEGENKFEIKLVKGIGKTTTCSSTIDTVNIVFSSKGITETKEEVNLELQGDFNVKKITQQVVKPTVPNKSLDGFINGAITTSHSSSSKVYYGDIKYNYKPTNKIINNVAWFNSLEVVGNRSITINNLAIFNSISINGQTLITVNGDAIFFAPRPAKQTNKARICIAGNPFIVENGSVQLFSDIGDYFVLDNSCKPPVSSNNWAFDTSNGITVEYK